MYQLSNEPSIFLRVPTAYFFLRSFCVVYILHCLSPQNTGFLGLTAELQTLGSGSSKKENSFLDGFGILSKIITEVNNEIQRRENATKTQLVEVQYKGDALILIVY